MFNPFYYLQDVLSRQEQTETGIHHFDIFADDPERAIEFYPDQKNL